MSLHDDGWTRGMNEPLRLELGIRLASGRRGRMNVDTHKQIQELLQEFLLLDLPIDQ